MAKPRLVKVRALFYVFQHVTIRGCIRILIHPLFIITRLCFVKAASFREAYGRIQARMGVRSLVRR